MFFSFTAKRLETAGQQFITTVLRTVRDYLRKRVTGRDSEDLCGPALGLMVNTPPNLSNIQDFGAANRFKCFFGPRGILTGHFFWKGGR